MKNFGISVLGVVLLSIVFVFYQNSERQLKVLEFEQQKEMQMYEEKEYEDIKEAATNAIIGCITEEEDIYQEWDGWEFTMGDPYCIQMFSHIGYAVDNYLKTKK